ncbi:PTS sugar transporter subunit IIA [bacterium]|nr:PTS sugar transporter subunit IIA [bacterium]
MLEKVLTEDVIRLNVEVDNWEGAVRAGGQLLLDAGKCNPEYIDAMVRTVEKMGPYMVLAPGLALAHARPQDGTLAIGLSLITLKTPVAFGSKANDPVELVISFCAVDKEGHVDVLKALAGFLREEANQRLLKEAETVDEILTAFADQAE